MFLFAKVIEFLYNPLDLGNNLTSQYFVSPAFTNNGVLDEARGRSVLMVK